MTTHFTTNLLRRLATGKRLAPSQLTELERDGYITITDTGQPQLTRTGINAITKGSTQ